MRAKTIVVAVMVLVPLAGARGVSPARAQSVASSPAAADCPVRVVAIVAREPADTDPSGRRSYAALLGSPGGPAKATGKMWVNASGKAFSVTFAHRDVVSPAFAGAVDPIVFRLPPGNADVKIDDAFVSDLPAPGGGPLVPCKIAGVWTPGDAISVPAEVLQQLASPSRATAVDAHAIAAGGAQCRAPDVAAAMMTSVAPSIPPIAVQQGISGSVVIVVRVGADGVVAGARIAQSPSQLLDAAALSAARASVYRAAIAGCRPVASSVVFRADFR